MTGSAQVVRGNARDLPLADNAVDLVVTSPPYFALRSYQDGGEHYAGQIGDEPTPAAFVDSLLEVTAECVRVLKPSGSLWVNLGDKYSGAQAQNFKGGPRGQFEASKTWTQTNPRNTGIPNKSLMGIPWRYALRCIDDLGLILRAEVIWAKPNGLPESVTDRVRRSHETWFHFTPSPRYFSAVDEIREPHLVGMATGTAIRLSADESPYRGAQTMGGNGHNLGLNPLGKLPGSVWTIPTQPLTVPDHLGVDHFAAFPMEWPRRIIAGWSPAGVCVVCGEGRRPVVEKGGLDTAFVERRGGHADTTYSQNAHNPNMKARASSTIGLNVSGQERHKYLTPDTITGYACACTPWDCHGELPATRPAIVLDPFGGTGTTALVAKALGRHGISVDMSADYCRLAQWRTNDPDQLAKAMQVEKPPKQIAGQIGFDFEEAA